MAKEVTFKLNLKVDGKDVVKNLTVDVEELKAAMAETQDCSQKLATSFINYNQAFDVVQNITNGFSQLSSVLNGVTADS